MGKFTALLAVFLSVASALMCGAEGLSPRQLEARLVAKFGHSVTNVAQLRTLSGADYLEGCDFHLTGTITLTDSNRDLLVLQDSTGAVAFNFRMADRQLQFGQLVTLDGTNCCPLFAGFPDYPYRPSGWEIRKSFDTPTNWGEYHLTRMRGYLQPPVTGNYRFWIASDNSSELWLSTDANPAKARRIASVVRFGFVNPHEWSKYPSQRSELIPLKAGEVYYLEALAEQTDQAENLSVAWQVPPADESPINVIEGHYLAPWSDNRGSLDAQTNGILREFWTNYTAGDLTGVGGARPFEAALCVKDVSVTVRGPGELPKPDPISLSQKMPADHNYCWVQVEGTVEFKAADADGGVLEISDGLAVATVRVLHSDFKKFSNVGGVAVRVVGVCEETRDRNNYLVPGLIWVPLENCISFLKNATTNTVGTRPEELSPTMSDSNQIMQGFYGTHGVVTFNDRVFNKDYVIIQEDAAVMLVNVANRPFRKRLKVAQRAELGGLLDPLKTPPEITPIFVADLGKDFLPVPVLQPMISSRAGNQEGRWSELEGVVHAVNHNGTLSVMTKGGSACLWLGETPANSLAGYLDAKLRARGALMFNLLDTPMLLVPSRSYLDVEEPPPENPFGIARCSIASLRSEAAEAPGGHRVLVAGEVTYRDAHSLFVQDSSGGIRVQTTNSATGQVGETVQVVAFSASIGAVRVLTDPLVRPAQRAENVRSKNLDLSEALSLIYKGNLVHLDATLLDHKTNGTTQMLELQEQHRVFAATLTAGHGNLPELLPGSRLRITGVCDDETPTLTVAGEKPTSLTFPSSLNLLLRDPRDVTLLSGPPWWTWKKASILVGMLLTILTVALLWVHLLHRRLERQQAAQLAFSQEVLGKLEEERRRIAVNLHDSLGQTLLVIKNNAILATQAMPAGEGVVSRIDEISNTTSHAIEEIRRITHGLRPYQLDRLGLTQAIRTSVNQAAENGSISFATRVDDIDGVFDKDTEIHVYRIVQEAVTNVVKHAAATETAVVIKKRSTVVSLSIRDNGKGFDPATPSSRPHDLGLGLTGIGERARILGGTLAIESKPGEGTILTVEIPIKIHPNACEHEK
jgi:signal transduction histidine kinase